MNPAKPKNLEQKGATPQSVDILKEIQEWFQNQCDGEWEHARRITLESCDNPGWWLKIDLQGTNLENKEFKEIKTGDFSVNMPEPPWIHLYVENGVFNGAGDVMQLKNILRYFLDWAQE
ncbi:MAG: immunity 53 family protein [Kiritimatiellae bacterium]|nr:immunity 53 family protein [Kiritimatiellia bacterium]